jgi:spermidine synthase
MLGGGGFTVVRDFLARHEGAKADIVEIDPVVTELADAYFERPSGNAVRVFYEDARMFLNRAGAEGADGSALGAYDIVYGDAFGSDHAIPFHLATLEAAQAVSSVLSERGVYVLNIIASESGRSRRLLDAEVRTLQAVFPQVMAFRVPRSGTQNSATGLMNVIVVASKQVVAPHELQATRTAGVQDMLANAIDVSDTAAAQLLTDDFAPVEALLYL